MTKMIVTDRASDVSTLAGWAPAWADLVAADPHATPFQSWAWARAWLQTVGAGRTVASLLLRDGRDAVALIPLYRSRGPWQSLRFIGTGNSDYLLPIIRPGYEAVTQACLDELVATGRGDLLDLHQVPDHHPLAAGFPTAERTDQSRCLRLSLPPRFDDYVPRLSKSLRYEVRRRDKGLYKEGRATLDVARTEDEARTAWNTFLDLHSRRWRRRGLPGAFALPAVRRLHEAWIPLAHQAGEVVWITLRHDQRPVGVWYGMRTPRTWYFFQSGFDPAAAALSPGTVLVAEAIRLAIEDGATGFDFLRGDEPYKRRWAPDTEGTNVRMMIQMSGMMSGPGATFNRAGHRIETALRQRFEGRSLRS